MTTPPFRHLQNLDEVPADWRQGIVAIGNFDGVHRGHQQVINQLRTQAAGHTGPTLVMSFEPHPRTVFNPTQPVFRLTPATEKAALLRAMGIDGLISVPFDRDFAARSADDFVNDILINRLDVHHVAIGYDFHYGKARAGTPQTMLAAGETAGFAVTVLQPYRDEAGQAISSTAIRQLLQDGDPQQARTLLGYHWFFDAEVIHGEKRGRELGYPTANMQLPGETRLKHGIYAVKLCRPDGRMMNGVASYGRRPQFDNGTPLFETYIPGFGGDLYGETLRVALVDYLRPELKFDSLDGLIAQMAQDTEQAIAQLEDYTGWSRLDRALHGPGLTPAT